MVHPAPGPPNGPDSNAGDSRPEADPPERRSNRAKKSAGEWEKIAGTCIGVGCLGLGVYLLRDSRKGCPMPGEFRTDHNEFLAALLIMSLAVALISALFQGAISFSQNARTDSVVKATGQFAVLLVFIWGATNWCNNKENFPGCPVPAPSPAPQRIQVNLRPPESERRQQGIPQRKFRKDELTFFFHDSSGREVFPDAAAPIEPNFKATTFSVPFKSGEIANLARVKVVNSAANMEWEGDITVPVYAAVATSGGANPVPNLEAPQMTVPVVAVTAPQTLASRREDP